MPPRGRPADPVSAALHRLFPGRHWGRLSLDRAALALALTPFLIGPPVAALAIGLSQWSRAGWRRGPAEHWRTIMLLALLNILLSLLFWRYVLDTAGSSLVGDIGHWLRMLFGSPRPSQPGAGTGGIEA